MTEEEVPMDAPIDDIETLRLTDPDEYLRLTDATAWVQAHDVRPRCVTTKAVNLAQLDAELGGHGLSSDHPLDVVTDGVAVSIVVADDSPVTQKDIDAAVAAHVAVFPPTVEERRTAIIDAATDWKSAMKQLAGEGLLA